MAEEEKFECVFGYGDCPVRAQLAKEGRDAQTIMKGIPFDIDVKDVPPEVVKGLNLFMQGMIGTMVRMVAMFSGLRDVGPFCAACPKKDERA